jgi:PilZ domain
MQPESMSDQRLTAQGHRAPAEERRGSSRVAFRIPVELSWGESVEASYTVIVNEGGGLVESDLRIPAGELVELTNLTSGQRVSARVVAVRFGDRQRFRLGLAFEDGDRTGFWGEQYQAAAAAAHRQQHWSRFIRR